MKTYWLVNHENRLPVPRSKVNRSNGFLEDNIEPDNPLPLAILNSNKPTEDKEKDKRIYSPITFRDVRARFSISEMSVNHNLNKAKGKLIIKRKYSKTHIAYNFFRFKFCLFT